MVKSDKIALYSTRNVSLWDTFGAKSVIFGQKWYIPGNFGQEKKENFIFDDKKKKPCFF